jgi:hypothetical protein
MHFHISIAGCIDEAQLAGVIYAKTKSKAPLKHKLRGIRKEFFVFVFIIRRLRFAIPCKLNLQSVILSCKGAKTYEE